MKLKATNEETRLTNEQNSKSQTIRCWLPEKKGVAGEY